MSTVEEIELEIRRQARNDAKVRRQLRTETEKVQEVWRSHSPVDEGTYAASVQIKERSDVDGFPAMKVVATDSKAEYIEFGTGVYNPRRQGGNSPAFAPRAKTAAEFGGDESPADGSFGPIER